MKRICFAIILTFVLMANFAQAKPQKDVSPLLNETKNAEKTDNSKPNFDFDKENLDVSQPPADVIDTPADYYYPFTQSISPRIGTVLDLKTLESDFKGSFRYLLGFNYMFPRARSPQFELGADMLSDSEGHVTGVKRWIVNARNSFRPFYKAGLGIRMIGKEGLATFGNVDNYLAVVGLGFEDYFRAPMSLRMELEVRMGTEVATFNFVLGYSWAW